MRHFGFTGTQAGMTPAQKETLKTFLIEKARGGVVFHHGDCLGADTEAADIADGEKMLIIKHPPLDQSKQAFNPHFLQEMPPLPYLESNRAIVDACELLIAAPKSDREETRSGTWATVRYAVIKGISVYILMQKGGYFARI